MNKIELKKQMNKINREAAQVAKRDTCLICGKNCTSFCNSHIIPQFILKSITDNGHVLQGISAFSNNDKDIRGINNTWAYKVICNDCDKKYFADYENEQALISKPTTRCLAEIALKNSMMQLANRFHEIELYKMMQDGIMNKYIIDRVQSRDVRGYKYDFERAKIIIEKNLKSRYVLMFHHVLNYVTPIAMQGPILVHRDMDGEVVNDVKDCKPGVKMQQLHVGIFPLKSSTVILAFYHKADRNYSKFKKKFSRLNFKEKLQYLNYLVFKYCEHYALSPKISEGILNDINLLQLVFENNDYPMLVVPIYALFMMNKPLINWRQIPNLLDEQFKLR